MIFTEEDQHTIDKALSILAGAYQRQDLLATSPNKVKQFCQLQIGASECELFGVLFLDSQHQLIEFEILFRGTIDGASVYPREIAKAALRFNAAAVLLTHNHPSNIPEPSGADRRITQRIQEAMSLLDIRVLDHIICGNTTSVSMAERGLI